MGKTVKISESAYQYYINEDVFINGISNNKNKNIANLTYKRNNNGGIARNRGNMTSLDMLKTNLMDNNSGQTTYEVKLKGGFTSYNITDINGTEVMHYFKRKFSNEETRIKLGDTEYDLEMQDSEFHNFMVQFLDKVNAVVEYRARQFMESNKGLTFSNIYIYPVPSSSNFNIEMVKRIVKNNHTIDNLPVSAISSSILKKDTSNLEKDTDFIDKNRDYYNSERWQTGGNGGSHMQAVDNDLNRLSRLESVKAEIDKANEFTKIENRKQTGSLLSQLNYVSARLNNPEKYGAPTLKSIKKLYDLYIGYQEAVKNITIAGEYYDTIAHKYHKPHLKKVAEAIKYSKGPSIEGRTQRILQILKEYNMTNGLPVKPYDICMWQPANFQIKKLGNDSRMALKNYFSINNDPAEAELKNTDNSIVVIFDDNISGGATLSDICYQLQKIGVKYMIPITFGKMRTSYSQGIGQVINKPENGFNY